MSSGALLDDRVRVRAPGKINLFLGVGAVMDDGYHELATAFQAVSLYEDVVAEHADGFTVEVHGSGPIGVADVPTDDRNLAVRAARMLARQTGYRGGVHLRIDKGVPVAGGMGGGSADAAAALVACDALWETAQTPAQLHRLAARLGADVPFSLMGGTAIGTGRGDEVSPALARGRFDWVLVTSGAGLSTPSVYAELDRLRAEPRLDIAPVEAPPTVDVETLHALRSGDADRLAPALANDLQAAALSLRPDLGDVIAFGVASGALAGLVSGSGPTVAFLCDGAGAALELQVTLSAAGMSALHAHGPVPGARIVG